MKKIAVILLLVSYALSMSGLGIKQFYCCGKLKSTTVSFAQPVKEKCGKEEGMTGCCQTKFKSLKVKDSHIGAADVDAPVKHITELYSYTPFFDVMTLAKEPLNVANTSHAPPLGNTNPIYILHCIYRI